MNPAVLSSQSSFLVTFLASFVIWIMFGGLVVLWLIDGRIKKEITLHAIFSSVLAWLMTQMVKSLFPTLRPFITNGNPPLTITVPGDTSFPSGHSAAAFGLAIGIWLHNKKIGTIFVVLAVLVGIGRVLSNVHYTLDVVVGALLGFVVAYVIGRLHMFRLLK